MTIWVGSIFYIFTILLAFLMYRFHFITKSDLKKTSNLSEKVRKMPPSYSLHCLYPPFPCQPLLPGVKKKSQIFSPFEKNRTNLSSTETPNNRYPKRVNSGLAMRLSEHIPIGQSCRAVFIERVWNFELQNARIKRLKMDIYHLSTANSISSVILFRVQRFVQLQVNTVDTWMSSQLIIPQSYRAFILLPTTSNIDTF